MSKRTEQDKAGLDGLLARARDLGATAARLIPATALVVEDRFAALCAQPHRCPSYGLAPGCPPHALRPAEFRQLLREFELALVFKINASLADLRGNKRLAIARQIHVIAATLEREATGHGCNRAFAIAAGSCKELFCADQESCLVLEGGLPCPHADTVRPSLSALGSHFERLAHAVGWPLPAFGDQGKEDGESPQALMAGLVLLA